MTIEVVCADEKDLQVLFTRKRKDSVVSFGEKLKVEGRKTSTHFIPFCSSNFQTLNKSYFPIILYCQEVILVERLWSIFSFYLCISLN